MRTRDICTYNKEAGEKGNRKYLLQKKTETNLWIYHVGVRNTHTFVYHVLCIATWTYLSKAHMRAVRVKIQLNV